MVCKEATFMRYLKAGFGVVAAVSIWTLVAAFLSFYGWWMSPIAAEDDSEAFFAKAIERIEEENRGNTAFVLIERGEVVGEYYGQSVNLVDRNTLFPTASFSKWIAAWCVLSLVEKGKIDLDVPVSNYLSRWNLPEGQFDNDQVTVRRLLSHTAGLTDRLGFGDYTADEEIPSIEETLRNPRASGDREATIVVGTEPGSEFMYSGGGYLILQLVVEEVSGQRFGVYVRESILDPLEMSRSSFDYIGSLENSSQSFDENGGLAQQYRYAAAAATGFVSSAADLTKLVQSQTVDGAQSPLDPLTVAAMRDPHGFALGTGIWGLGTILYTTTPNGETVYGHDGVNEPAINVSVRINPETRDGFIMLVTGHRSLATTLGSDWVLWQTGYPDFLSTGIALESAILPVAVGSIVILFISLLYLWRSRHPNDRARGRVRPS